MILQWDIKESYTKSSADSELGLLTLHTNSFKLKYESYTI